MVMPDPLDLYGLKRAFARTNEFGDLLGETADPAFLRRARRALLPMPWMLADFRDCEEAKAA